MPHDSRADAGSGPGGGRAVLLTGGAGYIGSHVAVALSEAGWAVGVLDDLSNGSAEAVARAAALGGRPVPLHRADLRDEEAVDRAFAEGGYRAVVHLVGLKAVAESVRDPVRYYDVNVGATVCLLKVMRRHGVRDLVFSSSATVYGDPDEVPLTERSPVRPVNPYGRTKRTVEELLADVAASEPGWRVALLRYFNPVGAHPSGRIGEDPAGVPDNLLPLVMQVAVGRRPAVQVFGADYPTPDGTCLRDYIHVADLAAGHVAALEHLHRLEGCHPLNLGTGRAHSVREVLAAASRAVGRPIPFTVVGRRPGDVAATWADPTAATALLGWSATRTLAEVCEDAWRWQSANPDGYR